VLLVVAIIGLLSAIAIPNLLRALADTRTKKAMADVRILETQIGLYSADQGHPPDSLADLGVRLMLDPWGNPYQYLRIAGVAKPERGKWRKDRFLVPLNSDYDLYSMGPDGKSKPPLTAADSRDDIIRAGNGSFVGVATDY
jgi:general secretion pathway protein G